MKESLGFSSDGEPETLGMNRSLNSGRYSQFETQLRAIQSGLNSFCVEPNDAKDYGKWKLGFELGDYEDEIDFLVRENGILEGVYRKVCPMLLITRRFGIGIFTEWRTSSSKKA
ncbi:hypothetical protein C2S53_006262 [Perilla frutescens var. hirtella]|uniref:Uncharacterized protein n=1 Tax=Perilla frutescens var. hirtella TaxID=608512 RepID=A0AAD4IU96_PERFH|nr:hypothetical protein C2S53_006262 [Perilla frutescens var. hirtella]